MASPRGGLLCNDVDYMVKTGRAIHVPRSDELNRLKRYLLRNKRKMAVGATGVAAAAIIAGPAALGVVAIALTGKAATFGLTRAWRAARRYNARSNIAEFREMAGAAANEAIITKRDDRGLLSVNSDYAEILADVRYLCSHGGLTDTFNAFSELERDYDECLKWESAIASGRITSCKDAVTIWELIARVHFRFEALKPVFALIDDMVMYTVLEMSRMEAEFDGRFKGWWMRWKSAVPTADRLAVMNAAANHDAVLHTRGRMFGRTVDYTDWLRVALPPTARAELNLTGPHGNPASALDAPLAIGSGIGKDLLVEQTTGAAKEFGKQTFTGGFSGDKLLGAAVPMDAAGISGAAETVLGTLAEAANDYVNKQKYETKKTAVLYFFYRRDQTRRERIGTLRKLAKDRLESFIDKFDHWMTSHQEWKADHGSVGGEMAVRLLRRQKHALQVAELSKFIYEFHETLVVEANQMSESVERVRARAKQVIEGWVDDHPASHICDGHCYSSILHGMRSVGVAMDPSLYQRSKTAWDSTPVWRVTSPTSALESALKKLEVMV